MPLIDLRLVTGSDGSEPITVDEAKAHLRVDSNDDNDYISSLITTAREHLEESYGLALLEQTRCLKFDEFPLSYNKTAIQWPSWYRSAGLRRTQPRSQIIYLPRPPLTSVVEVAYVDADGVEQTLVEGTDYQVDS